MYATIIYHSESGNTKLMAELIASSMNAVEGMEATTFDIDNIDLEYAKKSKCIIIGTPIYAAGATAKVLSFLQTNFSECEPAGKLGGAFATANYVHGGGEIGIRSILDAMMVKGMLVYSGGAAYGKPVIHLGPVGLGADPKYTESFFEEYGKRMATKAVELF